MTEIFLLVLAICYLIYRIVFEVPKSIKKLEDKIDLLNLQLQKIEAKLNQINNN